MFAPARHARGLFSPWKASGGEAAVVIDVSDSFDPVSAARSGVVLGELLWVRCGLLTGPRRSLSVLDQALRAADLLLQSGGFGVLTLDMGNVLTQDAPQIPLATWFRFRRALEETQTLFLVLEQEPHASSSAAVVLDLSQSGIDVQETQDAEKQCLDRQCSDVVAGKLLRWNNGSCQPTLESRNDSFSSQLPSVVGDAFVDDRVS